MPEIVTGGCKFQPPIFRKCIYFGFLFRFWPSAGSLCHRRRVKRINFIQFLSFHKMYKHITVSETLARPSTAYRT